MAGLVKDYFFSPPSDDYFFSSPSDDSFSDIGSPIMTPTSTASDSKQSDIIDNLVSDLTDRISKIAVREHVLSERETILSAQEDALRKREEAVAKKEQDAAAFKSLSAIEKLKLAFNEIDSSNAAQAIEAYDEFNLKLLQKYGNPLAQKPAPEAVGPFKFAKDPTKKPYPQKFQLIHFDSEEPGPSRKPTWTESFGRTSASSSNFCTLPSPPTRTWPDSRVLNGPKSKGKAPVRDTPIGCTRIATTLPRKEKAADSSHLETSKAQSKPDVIDLTKSNSSRNKDLDTATSSKSCSTFKLPDTDGDDTSATTDSGATQPKKGHTHDSDDTTKEGSEPAKTDDKISQKQGPAKPQSILKTTSKAPTTKNHTPSLAEEWDSEVEQLEHDIHTGVRGFVRADGSTLRLINGIPSVVSTDAASAPSPPEEPTIPSNTGSFNTPTYDATYEPHPQFDSFMPATNPPPYHNYLTAFDAPVPSGEDALATQSYADNLYPNPPFAPYYSGTACSISYPVQTPSWYSQGPYRGQTPPVSHAWHYHFTPMAYGPHPPHCICNDPSRMYEGVHDGETYAAGPAPAQRALERLRTAKGNSANARSSETKKNSNQSGADQSANEKGGSTNENGWGSPSAFSAAGNTQGDYPRGHGVFPQNTAPGAGIFAASQFDLPPAPPSVFPPPSYSSAPEPPSNNSNLFGPVSTSQNTSSGIFGRPPSHQTAESTFGLFGNPRPKKKTEPIFDIFAKPQPKQNTEPSPNPFGKNKASKTNNTSGDLFGKPQSKKSTEPTSNLFAKKTPSSDNTGGDLFAKPQPKQNTKPSSNLFGTNTAPKAVKTTANLFKPVQSNQPAQPPANLFGAKASTSHTTGSNLFGSAPQPSAKQNSTFTWGQPVSTNGGSVFGNQQQNVKNSPGGLFGGNSKYPFC
jgi:hypothetical protein